MVYGVQPDRLLVFVPEYHIRGAIRLCDAKGQPLPPAADVETEAAGSSGDAYALAARRLRLETGAAQCSSCPSRAVRTACCTGLRCDTCCQEVCR